MLRLNNIHKSFGQDILFDGISLQMEPEERLGLIGRNATGKSTLFKIILGQEGADSGDIIKPRNYTISYLSQHINFISKTVLEVGCEGLLGEEKYNHYKVEEILFGLGFTKEDLNRSPNDLSGGFQVRLNLAKTLVSEPNLLLLDEPTNYLDIVAIRWISKFLKTWKNEVIIISHDRSFLDNVTTHSAILHRTKLLKVKGKTSKLLSILEEQEDLYEKQVESEEKQKKTLQEFIYKNHANPATATQARSRRRMLDRLSGRSKLNEIYDLDFDFNYAQFPGKNMMEVEDLFFYYEKEKPLIENLSLSIQSDDRIAVIGKNGKGKSTLLRLIANELQPISGTINPSVNMKTGFFGQTNIDRLNKKLTIEEEIESSNPNLGKTQVRGICGTMMFSGDDALKKISILSGGEKSRVLLGKIIACQSNFILLDEPTNHLDVQSVDALVESIKKFRGAVMIVTHDEMILKRVPNKLLVFQHGKVELFHGGYDDFLRRIGWDEEKQDKKQDLSNKNQVSKKELRKKRGQILNKKSEAIKPFKNKITLIENKICELENKLEENKNALQKANEDQDIKFVISLSKENKELHQKIDKLFLDLEENTKLYNEKKKYFDDMLDQ